MSPPMGDPVAQRVIVVHKKNIHIPSASCARRSGIQYNKKKNKAIFHLIQKVNSTCLCGLPFCVLSPS